MKKVVATITLAMTLLGASAVPARAGAATDAALALGAFAVFNQLFAAPFLTRSYQPVYVAAPPVVYAAPVYAAPAVTYYAPPAPPPVQREVVYPHGRYLLYGDGVTIAYQWVWVPNPPPPAGDAPQPTR